MESGIAAGSARFRFSNPGIAVVRRLTPVPWHVEIARGMRRKGSGDIALMGGDTRPNAGQESETSRVYVVEDDEPVRDGLRNLIASAGFEVAVFADADAFTGFLRGDGPGCLVLDVGLPGLSGLELQERLGQSEAALPIVFLTGRGDIPMSVRAMRAGAVTFLTKPFRPDELLAAIRDGIARDRAARAERIERNALAERYEHLTPRERDVMAGVVAGLLNKQIAAELGTKEATVKEQRAQVMAKMRAGSVADLVRMATRLRLIEPKSH